MNARKVAEAYWNYCRLAHGEHPDRAAADAIGWARDCVWEVLFEGGPDAVELVIAICETASNENEVGFAGAGPIETMLMDHMGRLDESIPLFDVALRTNPAVRAAFQWSDPPEGKASYLSKYYIKP